MVKMSRCVALLALITLFQVGISSLPSFAQEPQDDLPAELKASDPEVNRYVDSADKLQRSGKYAEAFKQLQQALDLCTRKTFLADEALLEEKLGAAYFVTGSLGDAKRLWLSALEHSVTTENLVLQAEVLIRLSYISQASGKVNEGLDLATRALELARKGRNLWIQSRCLGELGRLQLTVGKTAEARASIEEALRLDRLNQ